MTTLSGPDLDDERLEAHLRHVLHQVALASVAPPSPAPTAAAPPLSAARTRRRRALGAAVVAGVSLGSVAAWKSLGDGEIERIPVEAALQAGTAADGSQWWLLPTAAALGDCDAGTSYPGVVLVTSDRNLPGLEWDMAGVAYGEPSTSRAGCAPHDEDAWLAEPDRASIGRTRVGADDDDASDWGYLAAVHPDVVRLEVAVAGAATIEAGTEPLPADPHGPRYAAFTLPADTDPAEVLIVLVEGDGDRWVPR